MPMTHVETCTMITRSPAIFGVDRVKPLAPLDIIAKRKKNFNTSNNALLYDNISLGGVITYR